MNPAALKALASGDLSDFVAASTPGGIERQEKAGQTALVNSTDMPKDMRPGREVFEKVGFKFGADIDDIFVSAELPAGWTRRATDHSMHSDILDEKGRIRVGIFYKAAFYDRRASSYLKTRYKISGIYAESPADSGLKNGEYAAGVLDGESEIFRTAVTLGDWKAQEVLDDEAKAWLAARYPDHADPTAYWGDVA